eukprot:TRINITY_DN4115_c0_g1_i9.p1 TRINITY_DN4115_c0_g1~~TRINITY_DN4115_c0_g1_i9.p1  ORF type:complete len:179 (-),score=46.81 TRINITY_DN4115_c0_g1_i9:385-921(-)
MTKNCIHSSQFIQSEEGEPLVEIQEEYHSEEELEIQVTKESNCSQKPMIQVISETNNPLEDDHRDVGCTECKNEEEKLLEDPEEILKFFYEMQLKEEEEMRAEEEKTVRETLSKKMPTTPAHLYEQFKSHQDTNEVKTEPTSKSMCYFFLCCLLPLFCHFCRHYIIRLPLTSHFSPLL